MYYRNAKAAVVVVDIAADGFDPDIIRKWVKSVRDVAGNRIALAVAANKCDLKPPKLRPAREERGAKGAASSAATAASEDANRRRFGSELGNGGAHGLAAAPPPAPARKRSRSRKKGKTEPNPAYARYQRRLREASEVAAEVGANLYECSAKDGTKVSQMFSDVARALLIEWKTAEEARKRLRREGSAKSLDGRRASAGGRRNSLSGPLGARGAPSGSSCAC
jgi:GTPase SAR1 family protein